MIYMHVLVFQQELHTFVICRHTSVRPGIHYKKLMLDGFLIMSFSFKEKEDLSKEMKL